MGFKPILCVDFDGCIHSYTSGWKGPTEIPDPPVEGALKWLYQASEHFLINVYSSRSNTSEGVAAMQKWFLIYAFDQLSAEQAQVLIGRLVFPRDKPAAFLTIDDRAVCFNGNWSALHLDPKRLREFKAWWATEKV